jgi:ABC-type nitrate/sulfonate/bicarbonate transport system substrate-binding protein
MTTQAGPMIDHAKKRLLLAAGLILFGGACGAPAAAETITLRYGQSYSALRSIFSLPISVAEREGFFHQEGLDFRIVVPVPGGSDKMIDALHDGTADITHVATPFLINRALAGSDAVAIAAEFNNPVYSLVAKPRIRSFADLKGKTIGFADLRGTISISIRHLLALHGLRAGDYVVKVVEGTPARYACLQRGDCDAVPLGQPQDLSARAQGFALLGASTEATPEFLYTVTAARRSWAAAHQEVVVRYVRALRAAFRFIRNPAKRGVVAEAIAATTKASKAIAEQVLALYFEPERGVLPLEGELSLAGLAQVVTMMAEVGAVTPPLPGPERFVDLRYLHAAGIK